MKKLIASVRHREYSKYSDKYLEDMEYITTAEIAERWDISQRRVAIYCKEGRIKGAILKGGNGLLPNNTTKPQDTRKEKIK